MREDEREPFLTAHIPHQPFPAPVPTRNDAKLLLLLQLTLVLQSHRSTESLDLRLYDRYQRFLRLDASIILNRQTKTRGAG
jgi:hypothetical protein